MEKRQLSLLERDAVRRLSDDPSRLDAPFTQPALRDYWNELGERCQTRVVELVRGTARVGVVGPIIVRTRHRELETSRTVHGRRDSVPVAETAFRGLRQAMVVFLGVLDDKEPSAQRVA